MHPSIKLVKQVVDAELKNELCLQYISAKVFLSPSYLSKLFKQETGLSLTEYVIQRKIEYSRILLETTNDKINVVAKNCGIEDANYYSRLFKKYIGMAPSLYRKKWNEG